MLVAATERGVCAIRFGEDDAQMEADLRDEFPAAEVRRNQSAVKRWLDALLHHLRGPDIPLELPLDIRATAFQKKVWDHLREIPAGRTESYGEVAAAIGEPRAVRAVARACATNPVAVAIPCHRVVRGDGSPAVIAGERSANGPCWQTKVRISRSFGLPYNSER